MSDQPSNVDPAEQAERQTAAASAPQQPQGSQPGSNPLASVDTQKLIGLLKNPSASVKLQPATDWIYGAIGAAIGVIGMWFFVWALKEKVTPDASDIDDLLGGAFSSLLSAFDSPFWSFFGAVSPGTYLILSACSIALAAVALTLIGNWVGGRKRSWLEAVTYYGGSQVLFGAGLLVSGIVAFASAELGSLIAALLLAVNLVTLVIQGLALHEVSRDRVFQYVYASVGGFGVALYIVYKVLQ
ncbi:hypothetical protein [Cohnella sp. GCM10027633]|uniref:hypothetical protein n=1 Tax=unclassified Cohnella TaxID=2636738 RepID=UPI003627B351